MAIFGSHHQVALPRLADIPLSSHKKSMARRHKEAFLRSQRALSLHTARRQAIFLESPSGYKLQLFVCATGK